MSGMYGRKWAVASRAFLEQYPLCVWCLVHGRYNEGALDNARADRRGLVVDHIEPHRGNSQLFWDEDNWQTLCRTPCHDEVKQQHEANGKTADQWLKRLQAAMYTNKTRDIVSGSTQYIPAKVADAVLGRAGLASR